MRVKSLVHDRRATRHRPERKMKAHGNARRVSRRPAASAGRDFRRDAYVVCFRASNTGTRDKSLHPERLNRTYADASRTGALRSLGALPLVNRFFVVELVLLGLVQAVQNAHGLFIDQILDRVRDRIAVVAREPLEIAL